MITRSLRRLWQHFVNDSLFRNSVYLMLSSIFQSIIGFFFWIIAARIYTSEQVGIATSLISIAALISNLGLLGINITLIRYLSKSTNRNQDIVTGISITSFLAFTIGIVYLFNIHAFSPQLEIIRTNPYLFTLFLCAGIFTTLSALSDSIFTGLRAAKFVAATGITFGIAKLILIFPFHRLGAFGPYLAFATAYLVSLGLGYFFLRKFYDFRWTAASQEFVKKVRGFAIANYATAIANSLPSSIIPIIILRFLGASQSAFYYLAMTIANALYIIPLAATQSQLAEGSHDSDNISKQLKNTSKIIASLMIPAILIFVTFGHYILLVFGKAYSNDGTLLLQLLAISGIFISINYVINTILRIQHRLRELLIINVASTIIELILAFTLVRFSLPGIGFAWMLGEASTTLILFISLKGFNFRKENPIS